MTVERKIDLLYRLFFGRQFASNSGTFVVMQDGEGPSQIFLHSPTKQMFRVGTVLRNPAGTFMRLDETGDWSSYGTIEEALPE